MSDKGGGKRNFEDVYLICIDHELDKESEPVL